MRSFNLHIREYTIKHLPLSSLSYWFCKLVEEGNAALLNFSGPWENISTVWQNLLLQLYKTLPNLTLPDQISIPFPNTAGGTHPSHRIPASNPDNF